MGAPGSAVFVVYVSLLMCFVCVLVAQVRQSDASWLHCCSSMQAGCTAAVPCIMRNTESCILYNIYISVVSELLNIIHSGGGGRIHGITHGIRGSLVLQAILFSTGDLTMAMQWLGGPEANLPEENQSATAGASAAIRCGLSCMVYTATTTTTTKKPLQGHHQDNQVTPSHLILW